MLQHMHVCGSV